MRPAWQTGAVACCKAKAKWSWRLGRDRISALRKSKEALLAIAASSDHAVGEKAASVGSGQLVRVDAGALLDSVGAGRPVAMAAETLAASGGAGQPAVAVSRMRAPISTSKAAEEDTPQPMGISETTTASKPAGVPPCWA